jgi:hypothetical protein
MTGRGFENDVGRPMAGRSHARLPVEGMTRGRKATRPCHWFVQK